MTSAIVDAATALASHQLSASDWAGAMASTGRGIVAVPGEERLYRLLFQAAARAGDQNTLHHALVELERYNEAHGLEMDQETLDLLAVLVGEGFGRRP